MALGELLATSDIRIESQGDTEPFTELSPISTIFILQNMELQRSCSSCSSNATNCKVSKSCRAQKMILQLTCRKHTLTQANT